MKRSFEPVILSTKEELLTALKVGDIKSSKYNTLTDDQKLFVEMIVFGGYSAVDAIKTVKPKAKSFKALANRWISLPNVAETLEELSIAKDKKFMAEISNARDLALSKLKFIMNTTEDESLAAVCAKTILDKAEKSMANKDKENTAVEGFKFAIELAKEVKAMDGTDYNKDDEIIIVEEKPIVDKTTGLNYALNYESVDNYEEE